MEDSGAVTCGVILFALVVGLFFYFVQQSAAAKRLREAHEGYRKSLDLLKRRPNDPDLRQRALELGRHYSNLTRNMRGVTVYDEVALSNDLNAACAAASGAEGQSTAETAPSIEARLNRVKMLLDQGIISEEEYRDRRMKLLEEV